MTIPKNCSNITQDCPNYISPLGLQVYGKVIYEDVFKNKYANLKEHFIVQNPKDLDDVGKLKNIITNNFGKFGLEWKKENHSWVPINKVDENKGIISIHNVNYESVVNEAFKSYLEWMTVTKFEYNSDQGARPRSWESETRELGYEIFYERKNPVGNCTVVNRGFLLLLQTLGFNPRRLGLTTVGTVDGSGAYVITKNKVDLEIMLQHNVICKTFSSFLKLTHYISKSVQIRPNEKVCEVLTTEYETPFPNHQYAYIDFLEKYKYYDARCGYQYTEQMGMFTFWVTLLNVVYWPRVTTVPANIKDKGVVSLPWRFAAIIAQDLDNLLTKKIFTVESPEVYWESILKLRKVKLSTGADTVGADVGWFPVSGHTPYGKSNTAVKVVEPTTKLPKVNTGNKADMDTYDGFVKTLPEIDLPYVLACAYGFFITDDQFKNLVSIIRKVITDYENRSFSSLRKSSEASTIAIEQLKNMIGGYDKGNASYKQTVLIELKNAVYALLGTITLFCVTPLKRDGALFLMIAEALKMPKFLR